MSGGPPFLGPDAISRLDPAAAVDALHAALAGGLEPDAQPPRTVVAVGAGELLVMPGVAAGVAVVKAVTVGRGEPRVQGAAIVFDAATLAPIAVLDGPALTNLRTAAVSALAVRLLAAPDARRLLIFGRGPQAHAHRAAIRAVRPSIDEVHLLGRADVAARPALVAAADVICCCTTATEPLFDGALVADHARVVAIGSHTPDAAETDPALAARATVVVESVPAALRDAGDVVRAIDAGALDAERLITLASLCRGAVVPPGPTLFKSVGMGWEDAVVAAAILAVA